MGRGSDAQRSAAQLHSWVRRLLLRLLMYTAPAWWWLSLVASRLGMPLQSLYCFAENTDACGRPGSRSMISLAILQRCTMCSSFSAALLECACVSERGDRSSCSNQFADMHAISKVGMSGHRTSRGTADAIVHCFYCQCRVSALTAIPK